MSVRAYKLRKDIPFSNFLSYVAVHCFVSVQFVNLLLCCESITRLSLPDRVRIHRAFSRRYLFRLLRVLSPRCCPGLCCFSYDRQAPVCASAPAVMFRDLGGGGGGGGDGGGLFLSFDGRVGAAGRLCVFPRPPSVGLAGGACRWRRRRQPVPAVPAAGAPGRAWGRLPAPAWTLGRAPEGTTSLLRPMNGCCSAPVGEANMCTVRSRPRSFSVSIAAPKYICPRSIKVLCYILISQPPSDLILLQNEKS